MKARARSLVFVFALVCGAWVVDCGGGDTPTNIPIMTAGTGGSDPGTAGVTSNAAGHGAGATTGASGADTGDAAGSGGAAAGEAGQGAAGAAGQGAAGEGGRAGDAGAGSATAGRGAAGASGAGGSGAGGSDASGSGAGGAPGGATRAQVQTILNANCVTCHGTSGGMSLTDVSAIVGAPSSECTAKMRVTAGTPATSYIIDKLMGASQAAGGCFSGVRMPRGRAALSATNIATISSWIRAGAN